MGEDAGEVRSEESVDGGDDGHDGQGPSHGSSSRLDDQDDHHRADVDVRGDGHAFPHCDGVPVQQDVQASSRHEGREHPVPGVDFILRAGLRHGIDEEDEASHEHPVHAPLVHGREKSERRCIEVEQRRREGYTRHHPVLPPELSLLRSPSRAGEGSCSKVVLFSVVINEPPWGEKMDPRKPAEGHPAGMKLTSAGAYFMSIPLLEVFLRACGELGDSDAGSRTKWAACGDVHELVPVLDKASPG